MDKIYEKVIEKEQNIKHNKEHTLIKIDDENPTKITLVHTYEYEPSLKSSMKKESYIQCMRQYQYDRMMS